MAEETTGTSAQTSVENGEAVVVNPQGSAGTAPPSTGAETTQPTGNWQDDPKFREIQSKYDQRIARLEQERLREAQRAQALQTQLRTIATRDMNDTERAEYEKQEAWQAAETYRQQLADLQMQSQRDRDIADIVEQTGVPREVLADATDLHDAWRKATSHLKSQTGVKAREMADQRIAKREANAVDIGGARAVNEPTFAERVAAAKKTGNPAAVLALYREEQRRQGK